MTPEEMAACHARAFAGQGRAWTVVEFASLLESPLIFAVGNARAFALGRVIADEAELLTLACDPAQRRKGLGRACLASFEAGARARGAVTAFLEVAADNMMARGLYDTAGYAEITRRAGYYARAGITAVDAIVMRKTFGTGRTVIAP
ncbi:ribosomal-protein-alanine N-acetyltransferase [Roseovarius sp. A-2]|uniref:GNAT family N-acetyltransferase n=1 Tax=Roseovarius sp. A-2 TaxID=1570360 RepID=UPI0009B56820|nr:GNAT family N-acetyltransferase [Roseovarius sp. A-2]GAW34594.1 ribosomal-protein-alanine N-acetyltransferase [Roseovarius sp. A-2]